jgi:hypothetical protein
MKLINYSNLKNPINGDFIYELQHKIHMILVINLSYKIEYNLYNCLVEDIKFNLKQEMTDLGNTNNFKSNEYEFM